ncbi:MAG TPA: HAD hydrolase-like protein [Anaerolineae bacterium]|nr:HAD hydrolase-like protein [Anaerolineae bacterium]
MARPHETKQVPEIWYPRLGPCDVLGQDLRPEFVPGVLPVLDALARRDDIGLGLATNNLARAAELRLQAVGVWQYFGCGGYAEDGRNKGEILAKTLQRCHLLWPSIEGPEAAILIGDQIADMQAARECRTLFVGVGNKPHRLHRLQEVTSACFPNYADTDAFLACLEGLWHGKAQC